MRNLLVSTMLLGLALASAPARAAETCDISDAAVDKAGGYGKAVEALVRSVSNCDRAYRALEACQLGSSGDNALSDIVKGKCEPLFMGKATTATKTAYRQALDRCDNIARKNAGTMYQGMAAVCRAGASRDFARKSAKR